MNEKDASGFFNSHKSKTQPAKHSKKSLRSNNLKSNKIQYLTINNQKI